MDGVVQAIDVIGEFYHNLPLDIDSLRLGCKLL